MICFKRFARLNVTDKAVSKWERGLSCPDVSLLLPISQVLDTTVSELLQGSSNEATVTQVGLDCESAKDSAVEGEADKKIGPVVEYVAGIMRRKAQTLRNLGGVVVWR